MAGLVASLSRPAPVHEDALRAAYGVLCVGFEGTSLNDELKRHLDAGARAVILFGRNVQEPEQVARLCADIKRFTGAPTVIGTDQEGGSVQRLKQGFTLLPTMRQLGDTGNPHLARELGGVVGRELRAVGIDMDFAPVLDVDTNPQNPVIAERSFSADAGVVLELGIAFARGLEEAGVASCAKHFPGHGDTELDSHLALARVRRARPALDEIELAPFRAYARAGLAAMMTAHVVFDALDPGVVATHSARILTDLLRREWDFQGLIVTDDLNMGALSHLEGVAAPAIAAGADLLLVCRHAETVERAARELARAAGSESFRGRLLDAARRVEDFTSRWGAPPVDHPELEQLGRGQVLAAGASGHDPTRDGNW